MCKVLEHIVHSQYEAFGDAWSPGRHQHGFRAKHSTETQLILTVNDLTKALEDSESIRIGTLDFEKAFDNVPHERLLQKLHFYASGEISKTS